MWLLYHLFDKTDFSGFWEHCRALGIAPENFPTPAAFEKFVQNTLGVSLDTEHLRELRYQKASADLAIDLTFDGRLEEAEALRSLPYGLGYARERETFDPDSLDAEDELRLRLLARNYLDYAGQAAAWRRADSTEKPQIAAHRSADGRRGLFTEMPGRGWQPGSLEEARATGGDTLYIGGEISLESLRMLGDRLRLPEPPGNRYTRENLFASKDFRARAALRYVKTFSRRLDIASPLNAVLSFPLGVNVITLGEAVNAYQVFQEGGRYRTRFEHPQLYIEKILTADGRVVFEDYAEREDVITDRTRYLLESILASVTQGGTGQRIGRELRIPLGSPPVRVPVPAYGKTGTTNDYRNAAFLGYIAAPKGQDKGFDAAAGYSIGVYTGFDDNRPMEHPGFRGTGSSTAIPAWLEIAKSIVKIRNFAERVPVPDPESWNAGDAPLFQQEQYKFYRVSRRTGRPFTRPENPAYTEDLSDELGPSENIQPAGASAPLWIRED